MIKETKKTEFKQKGCHIENGKIHDEYDNPIELIDVLESLFSGEYFDFSFSVIRSKQMDVEDLK